MIFTIVQSHFDIAHPIRELSRYHIRLLHLSSWRMLVTPFLQSQGSCKSNATIHCKAIKELGIAAQSSCIVA